MLVIPALDLRHGHCVRVHRGRYEDESVYFADPVRMAKLWRVMNAKTVHIVDHDTPQQDEEGAAATRAEIVRIAAALDIPVQTSGRFETMADVEAMLDQGVYRVALPPSTPDEVADEALARYSPSRVVAALNGTDPNAAEHAAELERRGFRRLVVAALKDEGEGPDFEAHRRVAEPLSRARVTAAGGVRGYRDLLTLQALEPHGIDSVIVGRALYENRFPCQQFWCWHRKETVDLDRFSTARLALQGEG